LAQPRSHAHFFIGSITLAANLKSAQVAAAFKPGMAEKIVESTQRAVTGTATCIQYALASRPSMAKWKFGPGVVF